MIKEQEGIIPYRKPGFLEALRRSLFNLSESDQFILLMAGLPLVDGVFASALVGGIIPGPMAAIIFGLNVFSGSGCLAAAFSMEGTVVHRIISILRIYILFIFPGAVITLTFSPLLQAAAMPGFAFFSGLILLGIAIELWGFKLVPSKPPPMSTAARWLWAIRLLAMPQVILAAVMAASILRSFNMGIPVLPSNPWKDSYVLLAVLAGLGMTLSGGLMAARLRKTLDPKWMRRGGAVALSLLALIVIGVQINGMAPLIALGIGLIIGLIRGITKRKSGTSSCKAANP